MVWVDEVDDGSSGDVIYCVRGWRFVGEVNLWGKEGT